MSETPTTPPGSPSPSPAADPGPGPAPAVAADPSVGLAASFFVLHEGELDPIDAMRARGKHPEIAALLAWLIPGTGHLYAGHPLKGFISLVLVTGTFLVGLWVSRCEAVSLEGEMGHPYAFLGQVGVGLPTGLALAYSHGALPWKPDREAGYFSEPGYVANLPDVDTGLLLTMVAGLLNLLLIHDALNGIPGALQRRLDEARQRRRLDALRAELERERAQAPPEAAPPATSSGPDAAGGPA